MDDYWYSFGSMYFFFSRIRWNFDFSSTTLKKYDKRFNLIKTYDLTDLDIYQELELSYSNNSYLLYHLIHKKKLHQCNPADLILSSYDSIFRYQTFFLELTIADLNWLADLAVLKNQKLEINKNHIIWLQNNSRFDLLDWWVEYYQVNAMEFTYDKLCIDLVTCDNQDYLSALDWWLQFHLTTGLPLLYTKKAIDSLPDKLANDKIIVVLEWWLKLYQDHGLPMLYSSDFTDKVNKDILAWLFGVSEVYPEIEFVYSKRSFRRMDIEIYNWWLQFHYDTKRELMYTNADMQIAITENRLDLMNWWIQSGLELKYPENLADWASTTEMLDWMYSHHSIGLFKFEYTSYAIDWKVDKDLLNWWFQKHITDNLPLLYTNTIIDYLLHDHIENDIEILDMWLHMHVNYGIELRYTELRPALIFTPNIIDKFDWWYRANQMYQVPFPRHDNLVMNVIDRKNKAVIEWFRAHPNVCNVELPTQFN